MVSRWKRARERLALFAVRAALLAALTSPLAGCARSAGQIEARSALDEPAVRSAGAESREPGPSDEELSHGLEPESVIRAVVARSPQLRARAQRVRAMVAGSRAMGQLPPPMAMAQLWMAPLHAPFVYGDAAMLMLGVQQTFPPGAALDAEARAAAEEALAEAAMVGVMERDLAQRAARACADLGEATRRARLLEAQRALLLQLVDAARARLSTGGSALSDVARAQLDAARLEGDAAMAQGEIERARAEINVLLGRAPDAPLGELRDRGAELPALTLEQARAEARERRSEIAAARALERREVARGEAADAMRKRPEFTLGLSYNLARQSGMPDTWGATFGMSLPWLTPTFAAQGEAAQHAAMGARADADAARQDIDGQLADAFTRVEAARRQLSVLDGPAETAARRSIEAARAAYATGGLDASGWLDALRGRLEIALARNATRGSLDRALADVDRAVGRPVPRRPLAPAQEAR